jgi:hypothetical protein
MTEPEVHTLPAEMVERLSHQRVEDAVTGDPLPAGIAPREVGDIDWEDPEAPTSG